MVGTFIYPTVQRILKQWQESGDLPKVPEEVSSRAGIQSLCSVRATAFDDGENYTSGSDKLTKENFSCCGVQLQINFNKHHHPLIIYFDLGWFPPDEFRFLSDLVMMISCPEYPCFSSGLNSVSPLVRVGNTTPMFFLIFF